MINHPLSYKEPKSNKYNEDFIKDKKYNENTPSHIVQKARISLYKKDIQASNSDKVKLNQRDTLTPVEGSRIEVDNNDLLINRAQSAADVERKKDEIFNHMNSKSKLSGLPLVNLGLKYNNNIEDKDIIDKIESEFSTGLNSVKTQKNFIIRHRRSTSNHKSSTASNASNDSENIINVSKEEQQLIIPNKKKEDNNSIIIDESINTILEEKKSDISSENTISSGNTNNLMSSNSNNTGSDKQNSDNNNNNNKEKNEVNNKLSLSFLEEKSHMNIKIGELLGEGAYGQVYKALNLDTGNFIAVKHIKLGNVDLNSSIQIDNLFAEIRLYKTLEHENIVRYLGCHKEADSMHIYMEYMPGGSVSSMLKQYGSFDERLIKKFTKQVLLGLEYLHGKYVIHRDIKGGNIISDGCGNVKLADFGASKHIENLPVLNISSSDLCSSIKGSLYWMAPELLNQEKHGRRIDIWSLGCTIIEMATANHPWPNVKSYPELVLAIMTKKCPPIPETLSETAKDFIRKCCQFDKKLRPRTHELLQHAFLKDTTQS